jgi:uncharacterized peroxidase-related enzyme
MSHIPLPEGLPGIVGLLAFKPTTGARLAELMHQLLRGESPLSPTERELIAAYVSAINDCEFCARSHASAAQHLAHGAIPVAAAELGPDADGVDPRLRALLRLAAAVVAGGAFVTEEDVAAARAAGAGDEEIHDTVLLAAAFCMVNRYVDGLATPPPDDDDYDRMGAEMARRGYRRP